MRWIVEVSSLGKTDLQKFCVEAESWQRALQAARAQRGEEGPMSGFSIELLEEGYRAVDPLARIRFVVKRAPDDMPITAPLAKDAKAGVAPSPQSAVAATADTKTAPATISSPPPATKSVPPRPGDKVANGPASQKAVTPSPEAPTKGTSPSPISKPTAGVQSAASGPAAPAATAPATPAATAPASAAVPPAGSASAPPAVGSALPGLPAVKVLSAREQDPTDASPLTYREYSFVVPAGTSEEVAVEVLRGQLKLVDAHLANAKMGKLVNLAVFDVEFTGKPPAPVATLTWKDWKGAPVIGYPRRGAGQKQVKPPSTPPPALQATAAPAAAFPPPSTASSRPPAPAAVSASQPPAAPFPLQSPFPVSPSSMPPPAPFPSPTPVMPQALLPQQQAPAATPPASVPPPAQPAPPAAQSAPPPAPASAAPPAPASAPPPPPPVVTPSQPPPAVITAPVLAPAAVFPPATQGAAPPAFFEMPVATVEPAPAAHRGSSPDGMVRTPSGRFVRGRTTGDELITALFESMHDLHFLRDALDGGQFCLALATEVLPARAAIIHFFDVEKREWVVACTRGKDTSRLLTLRTPENDELLRDAARVRRAVVTANATATAHRYESLGGTRSMIIAPIMQAGRALGAIEIINPLDGMPFTDDEGNAMTYIAEQYAEYLGSRGIVLDRERIQAAATR